MCIHSTVNAPPEKKGMTVLTDELTDEESSSSDEKQNGPSSPAGGSPQRGSSNGSSSASDDSEPKSTYVRMMRDLLGNKAKIEKGRWGGALRGVLLPILLRFPELINVNGETRNQILLEVVSMVPTFAS